MDHKVQWPREEEPMLIAEASVETERPSRYLVQLCRHLSLVAQTQLQMQAHVEWSDDHGMVDLGWGRCTLRADPGVLTLRAEAPDEERLRQLEQRVADRLEQVGRRDRLTVAWRPSRSGQQPPRRPTGETEDDERTAHG